MKVDPDNRSSLALLLHQSRRFVGNQTHLRRLVDALETGSARAWDRWRKDHPRLHPDLRGLDLTGVDPSQIGLRAVDLSSARLTQARLSSIKAWQMRFQGADLRGATLDLADLAYADLSGADLEGASLIATNLTLAKADRARFRGANLSHAVLNGAVLLGADLRNARVVGVSAWDVRVNNETRQTGLILDQSNAGRGRERDGELGDFLEDVVNSDASPRKLEVIGHVDSIQTAYLLHLVRDRRRLKTVIDAMTANLVLLLGRFGLRSKTLRDMSGQLVRLGYYPVIFDFDPPSDRDLIETVALLAGLSCFIIADLTEARSTALEAMLVIPQLQAPFAPIIRKGEEPFAMFDDLRKYPWVLPTWTYRDAGHLVRSLEVRVVEPCEAARAEIRRRRREVRAAAQAAGGDR
jgi:uncharacterized protein YjbI with pentapeptide repeats